MINNELAEQAVDKLLKTGDESLHRLGCGIFRWQTVEAANGVCSNPILNEFAALESKLGGVSYEFIESAIAIVESRLKQWENKQRQLIQQINEVVIETRQLEIVKPNEVKSK